VIGGRWSGLAAARPVRRKACRGEVGCRHPLVPAPRDALGAVVDEKCNVRCDRDCSNHQTYVPELGTAAGLVEVNVQRMDRRRGWSWRRSVRPPHRLDQTPDLHEPGDDEKHEANEPEGDNHRGTLSNVLSPTCSCT